jgi:isoleucyl-tRNA synthetase
VIKHLQEQAREKKQLGSSLQSFVHLVLPHTGDRSSTVFHQYLSELPDLFVVSSVTLADPGEALPAEIAQAKWQYEDECELPGGQEGRVYVYAPQASKCARCWRYAIPEPVATAEICDRCDSVVSELEAAAASAASPVV